MGAAVRLTTGQCQTTLSRDWNAEGWYELAKAAWEPIDLGGLSRAA